MNRLTPPAALATFLVGAVVAAAVLLYTTPEPWWVLSAAALVGVLVGLRVRALLPACAGAPLASTSVGLFFRLVVSIE